MRMSFACGVVFLKLMLAFMFTAHPLAAQNSPTAASSNRIALTYMGTEGWEITDAFTDDPWLSAAVHVALQLQKNNQGKSHNKGLTFLVFDENKAKADILADLLWDVPRWTDDYYNTKSKQDRLDQLIDSAFTVKSHHAGLVQIADLYAFILRRFVEFRDFGKPEECQVKNN